VHLFYVFWAQQFFAVPSGMLPSTQYFICCSVADLGCFILDRDPRIFSSRISDPGSYVLSKMGGSKENWPFSWWAYGFRSKF
jgi:hypothetical protein